MERIDRSTTHIGVAAFILAAFAVAAATFLLQPSIFTGDSEQRQTVTVTEVVDGDTVNTRGGETIRLLGVDAAEKGEPCYQAARDTLHASVKGKPVAVEAAGHGRDRYDRLLRYLYVNGTNINVALVRNGVAKARISPDVHVYRDELIAAEEDARQEDRGCAWEDREAATVAVDACDAAAYHGEHVNVTGDVVDTGVDTTTQTVFLNFEHPYPGECFTAIIFRSARHRFPDNPAEYYDGETVTVTGTVKNGSGTPETVVDEAEDITVHD